MVASQTVVSDRPLADPLLQDDSGISERSTSSIPLEDKLEEIRYLRDHELSVRRLSEVTRGTAMVGGALLARTGRAAMRYLQPEACARIVAKRRNRAELHRMEVERRRMDDEREELFLTEPRKQWRRRGRPGTEGATWKRYASDPGAWGTDDRRRAARKQHELEKRRRRIDEFLQRREQAEEERAVLRRQQAEVSVARHEQELRDQRTNAVQLWNKVEAECREKADALREEEDEREKRQEMIEASRDAVEDVVGTDPDEGIIECGILESFWVKASRRS